MFDNTAMGFGEHHAVCLYISMLGPQLDLTIDMLISPSLDYEDDIEVFTNTKPGKAAGAK